MGDTTQDLQIGDYVVATKYSDGDGRDGFCVGVLEEISDKGRFIVVGDDEQPFRSNGFAKAKAVSGKVGALVVENLKLIEDAGLNVWEFVAGLESDI